MGNSPPGGREQPQRELSLESDESATLGSGQSPSVGEPGQGLNLGEETPPRQAATVILLRGGSTSLEVLLVKRTEKARFMGGVWVFPGGAVDSADGAGAEDEGQPHRVAAIRELFEEAQVAITDPSELVEFSRWITPAQVSVRFDTRFFLAELPKDQEPKVDGQECVDQGWFTPQGALDANAREEVALVFPTIKHLEQLGAFSTVTELLKYASGRKVLPVQPKVWFDGEVARVLLPGEPGYDD